MHYPSGGGQPGKGKKMIKIENGKRAYFDKHGNEIVAGSKIMWPNGRIEKVYLTQSNELGTDATNPQWIESGKAVPCEYGIYPLSKEDTEEIEIVE